MDELAVWWVAVEAVGVAAFPLAFVLFHRLPDRGYAFAKVLGLVLIGYGLWMGSLLGLIPNSRGSVILLLALLAAGSLLAVAGQRRDLAAYLKDGWRYVLFVEATFTVVLAAAVYLRSFAPNIDSGEKPFEFAFLNSINRTESFPPPDPWLSGHSISYYYFGYVVVAALTKLTGLSTSVTFFFGVSLMGALAWTGAFGLVYNLLAAQRQPLGGPALSPRPLVFGLAAAALLIVASNLEGVFELLARHGVGSRGFYDALGIYGLPGPYDCSGVPADCARWYPTRNYWWWWATRIGSNYDIQEFPFFSLHFGDLHAHVMAMPILIVLLAVAYQMLAGPGPTGPMWFWRSPRRFLLTALLAGAAVFTDAWAAPLTLLLLAASAGLGEWLRGGRRLRAAVATGVSTSVALGATMFVLFLPYYWHLESDAHGVAVAKTAFTSGAVPQASEATGPVHFLLFWTPLLWVVLSGCIAFFLAQRWRGFRPQQAALGCLLWAAPILFWALAVVGSEGFDGLGEELRARGASLITLAALAVSVTIAALSFLRHLDRAGQDPGGLFASLLAVFALEMLLGAELYYVKDALGFRANTVFRFWHEGWMLLALAGGYGLYEATRSWRLPRMIPWVYLAGWGMLLGLAYSLLVAIDPWQNLYSRWWTAVPGLFLAGGSLLALAAGSATAGAGRAIAAARLVWLGATAVVLAGSLVYPVLVAFDRTGGFTYAQTVDGLDFVRRQDPDEYEAIRWLNDNVRGTPVIAEATGGDFSASGRISSRTGLPTVIGWVNHEAQWRGRPGPRDEGDPALSVRPMAVSRLYTTSDNNEALAIVQRYGIEYVYVGKLERNTYGTAGLAKFAEFMDVAFQNGTVTIYRVREKGTVLPPG